jgi:hypothetical protein
MGESAMISMDTKAGIMANVAKRFGCSSAVARAGLLAGAMMVAGPALAAKGSDPVSGYEWERVTYENEQVLVVPRVYDVNKADAGAAAATKPETGNGDGSSLSPKDEDPGDSTSGVNGMPVVINVPVRPMWPDGDSRWRVPGSRVVSVGAAFVPSSPGMLPPGPVILPPGSPAFPPLPSPVTTMSSRTTGPIGADIFRGR